MSTAARKRLIRDFKRELVGPAVTVPHARVAVGAPAAPGTPVEAGDNLSLRLGHRAGAAVPLPPSPATAAATLAGLQQDPPEGVNASPQAENIMRVRSGDMRKIDIAHAMLCLCTCRKGACDESPTSHRNLPPARSGTPSSLGQTARCGMAACSSCPWSLARCAQRSARCFCLA